MTAPAGYDPSAFPPFAVTVDIAVFTMGDGDLEVALVERANDPFKGAWALPGGFVEPDEGLMAAALRELAEETGIDPGDAGLRQVGAYGEPDRDPRMRVVTVAYWTLVGDLPRPRGGGDAADARLVSVDQALSDPTHLAFDHHKILADAAALARASLEPRS